MRRPSGRSKATKLSKVASDSSTPLQSWRASADSRVSPTPRRNRRSSAAREVRFDRVAPLAHLVARSGWPGDTSHVTDKLGWRYGLDSAWEHERRRLELLEAVCDGATKARLAALGVGPGARCLELGADGGLIARLPAAASTSRSRGRRRGGGCARAGWRLAGRRVLDLTLEYVHPRMIDAGLIAGAAIDAARALLADPEFWDLSPAFVGAWGRKA